MSDTGYPDLYPGELDAIEAEDRRKAARQAPTSRERVAVWEAGLTMEGQTGADIAALEQARKEGGR